jgi:hypothetical protein
MDAHAALLLSRGLKCLSAVSAMNGENPLAIQYASEVIDSSRFARQRTSS